MMDRDMSHQLPNSQVRTLLAEILENEKLKTHEFVYEHFVDAGWFSARNLLTLLRNTLRHPTRNTTHGQRSNVRTKEYLAIKTLFHKHFRYFIDFRNNLQRWQEMVNKQESDKK